MTAQKEVDAEEAADTHSTVWRARGGIALARLHGRTEVTKTTSRNRRVTRTTLWPLTRKIKTGSKIIDLYFCGYF